jgi:predicted lipase
MPQMQKALSFAKQVPATTKISFTGHSLGAAMAQYAATQFGRKAIAFDPMPLRNSLQTTEAAKIASRHAAFSVAQSTAPISSRAIIVPAYSDITNFRAEHDPAGIAARISSNNLIGQGPIIIKKFQYIVLVWLCSDVRYSFISSRYSTARTTPGRRYRKSFD